VADDTTVDEFIRFLQAELVNCDEIDDKVVKEKRQWQIESSIQEAIAFLNEVRERESRGTKVFENDESVRVIARSVNVSDEVASTINQEVSLGEIFCKHCEEELTDDLSFCPSCGKYQ
tara:strand:- start:716 stop:1069 length:354 start_codon:yes stop_codon:yes gene_type:complete